MRHRVFLASIGVSVYVAMNGHPKEAAAVLSAAVLAIFLRFLNSRL